MDGLTQDKACPGFCGVVLTLLILQSKGNANEHCPISFPLLLSSETFWFKSASLVFESLSKFLKVNTYKSWPHSTYWHLLKSYATMKRVIVHSRAFVS